MATKPKKSKTKAKARGATTSPFAQQAQAEAFLRTNPERSTLAQQLADARGDRDTSISAANTAANANVAAARGAPAAYQRTYDDALSHVAAAISVPGADNPATGAGRDAAQTRGRLAEMLAAAQTDAKQRELSAREGGQYAVNQANAGYDKTSGTLSARLRSLAQEEGVYTAQREGELSGDATRMAHDTAQKAADRRSRERIAADQNATSIRTARIRTSASDRSRKGGRPASASDVKALRTGVQSGKTAAADLKTAGFSRAEAGALLTKGQRGSGGSDVYETVKTNSGTKQQRVLNADGTAKTSGGTPSIPQISDPLALSVALDLAYDGGISRANVKKLIAAGVAPGQFAAALGAQTQQQRGIRPNTRPSKSNSMLVAGPGRSG
jgi:hypothetical protein